MPYHPVLMADVRKLSYDFESRVGLLYTAEQSPTDAGGVEKVFEAIDPHVKMVKVFHGDTLSTTYWRGDGGWETKIHY